MEKISTLELNGSRGAAIQVALYAHVAVATREMRNCALIADRPALCHDSTIGRLSLAGTLDALSEYRRNEMTLCPVAMAIGRKKCPAFAVCPLKVAIGDCRKEEKVQATQQADKVVE